MGAIVNRPQQIGGVADIFDGQAFVDDLRTVVLHGQGADGVDALLMD